MKVLIDTSVWSLALRRKEKELHGRERGLIEELGELVREGRVTVIGPVRQELLTGVRSEKAFARLRDRMRLFPDEILTAEDYEEAAKMSNRCRAAGVAGSPVDFLICSTATRRELAIFTTDRDFDRYSKHIPVSLHKPRESSTRAGF